MTEAISESRSCRFGLELLVGFVLTGCGVKDSMCWVRSVVLLCCNAAESR